MDKHTERVERFNNLKHTKHQNDWEDAVYARESDLYQGTEIDNALDIMETLDECYEKISAKLSEQGHSGGSFEMVKTLLKHFHLCEHTIDDF